MKKTDFLVILIVIAVLSPFFLSKTVYDSYNHLNYTHGILMSFLKFAILATFGESIALRIKSGVYNQKGFGLIPRAIVWGFLGITIKMAMVIFATGTPAFLKYLGIPNPEIHQGELNLMSIFVAFSISTAMNLIYAPVMMTLHKITDIHIITNGGSLWGLLRPIPFGVIFSQIDWNRQWNFIFKKTIPFFWIPAHTITFLLPVDFQVLFAALLGVALGVILSFSSKN
ncbi:MAG: Mpv17/PMP22 family protein [Bacteroidales bacterium]